MQEFGEELSDILHCSIDWLSFTITDAKGVVDALGLFGFNYSDFFDCAKGAMGYKRMLVLNGSTLRVLYDGNDNMGVHFDVSGSAIGDLLSYYRQSCSELTPWDTYALDMDVQLVSSLMEKILKYGHITRIDLAIDNTRNIYYRLDELESILMNGRFVSKFRTWRNVMEMHTTGKKVGHTLYMGSRASSVMLRVYDKQLEQNTKLAAAGKDLIDYEWIRWELELKDERAQMAAEYLLAGKTIGELCVGVLENYFRIIVFDDSNKSRCSNDIKWAQFVGDMKALRLYVPHEEKTLDDKRNWIVRQVAPTLTALIIANYGDITFLTDNMELHAGRMKRGLRDLVDRAHPNWEECLKQFSA